MFLVDEESDTRDLSSRDGDHSRPERATKVVIPTGMKVVPRRTVERILSASRLIDEAKRIARRLVAQASQEADAHRQRAYDEGFAAGHGDALMRVCDASDAALTRLCNDQAQQAAIAEVIADTLDALLGERDDATRIRGFVARGLRSIHAPVGRMRIVVHPEQVDGLASLLAQWSARYASLQLSVSGVPEMPRDAYRIECGGEGADAQWWISDAVPDALAELKDRLRRCL